MRVSQNGWPWSLQKVQRTVFCSQQSVTKLCEVLRYALSDSRKSLKKLVKWCNFCTNWVVKCMYLKMGGRGHSNKFREQSSAVNEASLNVVEWPRPPILRYTHFTTQLMQKLHHFTSFLRAWRESLSAYLKMSGRGHSKKFSDASLSSKQVSSFFENIIFPVFKKKITLKSLPNGQISPHEMLP